MNKKQAISLLMVAALAFSLFACGKKSAEGETTVNSDITQPVFENGTAIVEYPSTNANGEEVTDASGNKIVVSTVVELPSSFQTTVSSDTADANGSNTAAATTTAASGTSTAPIKVIFDNKLSDMFSTEDEKQSFINSESDKYNISVEEAKQVISNSANWVGFSCSFYVVNTNKQRIATNQVTFNTSEDVIIKKDLDCEYNFKPGFGMTMDITGYVNTAKYSDETALIKALNSMNVQLVYTLTDETSIDDWSTVTTKTMKITF